MKQLINSGGGGGKKFCPNGNYKKYNKICKMCF